MRNSNNENVGYLRTSGDEIGCDIHPKHRRKGYARLAYNEYLKDKDYATLWVFEDNFAKNLYESLGFKEDGKCKIVRDRKYIHMEYKKDTTCYIMSFYLGERRKPCKNYVKDNLFYVKKQVEILQSTKHQLNKIIFNFNVEVEHYKYISEIFSIVPKKIQGSDIEINIRENKGISYKAWEELFVKYKTEYDYFIFNEDDYFFIEPNWDGYLINKYKSYDDCGYLCLVSREPMSWNSYKKNAGVSVGMASTESLIKIYNNYEGKLYMTNSDENYNKWEKNQTDFSFSFIDSGYNIYDVRDEYSVIADGASPEGFTPKCKIWKHHSWNHKILCVSALHFIQPYNYYVCKNTEFSKDYKVTSYEEARYCYDNKISYDKIKKINYH